MKSSNLKAHLALLFAASMWGLMAPIGKAAMEAGISGLALANMRMIGGAVCFWITSLFVRKEEVPPRDLMLLFFASMLGAWYRMQSGMLHFRFVAYLSGGCFHHDYHYAYCDNDTGCHLP